MEQKQIFKQMVEFNKMAFDNTFNAMTMFQEQVEKMTSAVLMQSAWLPEEGRKAIDEWIKNYKRGREDFKRAVDEGFDKWESLFSAPWMQGEYYSAGQ